MRVSPAVATPSDPPASWPRWANSGGPSSRTRVERVTSSLLGRDTGQVRCPRLYRLGLRFAADLTPPDPVDYLTRLLAAHGHLDPEALRGRFTIPPIRLLALPFSGPEEGLDVATAPPHQVLEQALLLGLCTRHLYDPARPVLWTTASLGRKLELFDPAGFYA